jgi:hypothetical protein
MAPSQSFVKPKSRAFYEKAEQLEEMYDSLAVLGADEVTLQLLREASDRVAIMARGN